MNEIFLKCVVWISFCSIMWNDNILFKRKSPIWFQRTIQISLSTVLAWLVRRTYADSLIENFDVPVKLSTELPLFQYSTMYTCIAPMYSNLYQLERALLACRISIAIRYFFRMYWKKVVSYYPADRRTYQLCVQIVDFPIFDWFHKIYACWIAFK